MRILQANTSFGRAGGGARVTEDLLDSYRNLGHQVAVAAGRVQRTGDGVVEFPHPPRSATVASARRWLRRNAGKGFGTGHVADLLDFPVHPTRVLARLRGREDVHFPGSRRLLQLFSAMPDVVQLHNLHGNYFDLRFLPELTRQVPTFVTLHDMWLFTGHCAHSFECRRYEFGCGQCPHPSVYPAVRRDATAENWRAKQSILGGSRLHVGVPSQWLATRVANSMLSRFECRVIPNGVDETVFTPGSAAQARTALGIPPDAFVALSVGASAVFSDFKDWPTTERSFRQAALGRPSLLVGLGAGDSRTDNVWHVPYATERQDLVRWYHAADVVIHAAKAENAPLVILEAMACGRPVIASRVGGIPEQIVDGDTGYLVEAVNADALSAAIARAASDSHGRVEMGKAGRRRVLAEFTLRRQAESYVAWFEEVLVTRVNRS